MSTPLRRFDIKRLYETLDAARRDQDLTWVGLLAELNKPFDGTPSIPISVSTVKGIANKSSVTSAVILQILRWLRRTPESFLSGNDMTPLDSEILPEPGPGRILRFDTCAIHAALDAERRRRELTWKEVAHELPGFTEVC